MRKIKFAVAASVCLMLFFAFTHRNTNLMSFTIHGDIDGLMPGYTLLFERVTLPGFKLDFAFDVIVKSQNEFTYSGLHENIGYYMMTYKPTSGKVTGSDRRGKDLLIKDGSTRMIGTADQIYYCSLEGDLYDNEALREALRLEISLGKERGGLMRIIEEARETGDTIKVKEYSDKFNAFQFEHQEDFQKLSQLKNEFYEKFPSSDHTVLDALQGVNSSPFEVSQSKYEKMNNDAQNSYFGKILKQEIDKSAALQPGNDAPDFRLTAIDGKEITLGDCAGSYVLIYHWGMCPGSITMDGMVIDLYNKYKDRLKVIGITDRIEMIKNVYDNAKPGDELMNIELKPVLEGMLSHPWFDAEKTGDNGKIETDYAFAGLPFFVFISPEGKIIERDFIKAFFVAKSTMESESGN